METMFNKIQKSIFPFKHTDIVINKPELRIDTVSNYITFEFEIRNDTFYDVYFVTTKYKLSVFQKEIKSFEISIYKELKPKESTRINFDENLNSYEKEKIKDLCNDQRNIYTKINMDMVIQNKYNYDHVYKEIERPSLTYNQE